MDIQVEQLVETATARAGCDDFGEDTWQEGLDVLVNSLTKESALNEMGVSVMIDQIVGLPGQSARSRAVAWRAS